MSEERPQRLVDMPFRMIIEGALLVSLPRRETVTTLWGHLIQGQLHKGDAIIIEGSGKRLETVVSGFIHLHYENILDRPPDRVDLFIPAVSEGEIEPGMIMTRADEHLPEI